MKSFLFILFLLIGKVSICQELPIKNDKVIYEYIFDLEGVGKDDLYTASLKFYAETFNNSNYVIKMQDKEQGKVIGKGFNEVHAFKKGSMLGKVYPFHFTVETDVKDNRARIRIYDIYAQYTSSQYGILRTETLEELNQDKLSGTDKKEKKLKEYQAWSDLINDNFLSIVALYKRAIEDSKTDDNW